MTTKVIEWNDLDALEEALAPGDVACVLAEPALTNIGIILPDPGYHHELRRLTRETGTLLIIDETHTICAGPGGCTLAWGLEPDMVTLGKPIGSGVPAAVYGFGETIADAVHSDWDYHAADECGIGGTLAGNMLSVAAVRATLSGVLTEEAYARMIPLAARWTDGVQGVIDEFALPWVVKQLGCRAEYWPRPVPPRNGGEAAAAEDEGLDRYLHLFMLNRGVLLTPFHNMALMSPQTTAGDVDRHTEVLREAALTLVG
jgi:glutamate-1-semialdehyde 2,1-aminomutase